MTELKDPAISVEIKIDGQTAESWAEVIANFADASIYQSWAYGAVRWGVRNLSHLVLLRDGKVLAAAQVRIARIPMFPAGFAYLRGGLFECKGLDLDSTVVTVMVDQLVREYVDRRGFALHIIPPAFCESPRATAFKLAFENKGMHPKLQYDRYQTIIVDLTPDTAILRQRLNQKWRNQLNRAEKNDVLVEVSDSQSAYESFMLLYIGMQQRKQFQSGVDIQEFGKVQAMLSGTYLVPIFLARNDGRVIGALVCSMMGNNAIYLLGATNEIGRELKVAYLLQWHAMQWFKQRGARTYDLGGIDLEANPGGHHFKNGFGGSEATQLATHGRDGNILSAALVSVAKWRARMRQHQARITASSSPG